LERDKLDNNEDKNIKKINKVLNRIGVDDANEIIDINKFTDLVENLSKLPAEALESLVSKIPNFTELSKMYLDNLNHSYNKVMDDLIEEKKMLFSMIQKGNLSDSDKAWVMSEIKEIRRTMLIKDTIYTIQNNKVFKVGVAALTVAVAAVAGSKMKK
jgi:50S ribosomal subunit-associated GTPase HflX